MSPAGGLRREADRTVNLGIIAHRS